MLWAWPGPKEMTATGAFVDAAEAARIGLVNHVVPHDELMARVHELAQAMAASNPPAVLASFALYDDGNGLELEAALALEAEVGGRWVVDTSTFGQ